MILLLATAAGFAQNCAEPVASTEIASWLEEGDRAYADLRVEEFYRSLDAAVLSLPCLAEPISTELAARYHRSQGVRMYVARDEARARSAFAAARGVSPALELPESVAPAGHAMRVLYSGASVGADDFVEVPKPLAGALSFDGNVTLSRPVDRPTIVQILAESGDVDSTGYLWPEDPMPLYAVERNDAPHPRRWVPVAVFAGSAAALYGVALASENAALDTATPDGAASTWKTVNHVTFGGAVGSALLAVGSGVVAATQR